MQMLPNTNLSLLLPKVAMIKQSVFIAGWVCRTGGIGRPLGTTRGLVPILGLLGIIRGP